MTILTSDFLAQLDACSGAMNAFKKAFPEGLDVSQPDATLKAIYAGLGMFTAWVHRELVAFGDNAEPFVNYYGTTYNNDFQPRLTGAAVDFKLVNKTKVTTDDAIEPGYRFLMLERGNLRDCDLIDFDCIEGDFDGARLVNVTFVNCHFECLMFTNATMQNVHFVNCRTNRIRLEAATVIDCNFEGITFYPTRYSRAGFYGINRAAKITGTVIPLEYV